MTAGRSYGGELPDDRVARRRRQLLDAGLEVVGTLGYRGTTVRGLCRAAGVTDRYFYESFPTTEDLLLAVYGECLGRLHAAVAEGLAGVADDADFATAAGAALDRFFRVVEDARLTRVVWLEVLGVSPRVDEAYSDAQRAFGAVMLDRARLAAGAAAPSGDADLLVLAAVGGINEVAKAWLLEGYVRPREDVVATATRFLVAVGRVALD